MLPGSVTLKNAYLDRGKRNPDDTRKVPQSFTFMQRQYLPRRGIDLDLDQKTPVHLRQEDSCHDIFAMIKLNMSDQHLSQKPLLVYPAKLLSQCEEFWNKVNSTTMFYQAELDTERISELQELYKSFDSDFPNFGRAVDFYKSMISPRNLKPFQDLKFLRAPKANVRWCQVNLGERPPEPKAHVLQVVFHRR